MTQLERVAEAIWRATVPAAHEKGIAFTEMAEHSRGVFMLMAQAAIDALGLTEERRTNVMSSSGMTTDTRTGITTAHSDVRYDTRLVSPWERDQ